MFRSRAPSPALAVALALALAALATPVIAQSDGTGNETATAANETAGGGNGNGAEADAATDGSGTRGADANGTADRASGAPPGRVLLSEIGFPECTEAQSVPQVVVDGAGGGRTVQDYVDTLCRAPVEAQAGDDVRLDFGGYVILLLTIAIAIGIAGAVYVRRHYTP